MKLLHTSDWHLGNQFNKSENRDEEFANVLKWFLELVEKEKVDLFLIAGDIFDVPNPPNDAKRLFYEFVSALSMTGCRHLVAIGGNHDSATLLDAPSELYSLVHPLNLSVIGGIDPENLPREVILLSDREGVPEAVVCAVPYIPERLLRKVQPGETSEEKVAKALEGLRNHYDEVSRLAEAKREEVRQRYKKEIPLIVTGHLFAKGSRSYRSGDDGVRDLTIGGLEGVEFDTFPSTADYIALGHIHRAYPVDTRKNVRYSGSIVPLGFDEIDYAKKICLAEFDGTLLSVNEVEIPQFRFLKNIVVETEPEIYRALDGFEMECGEKVGYFKVKNTGETIPGLYRKIVEYTKGKNLQCCAAVNVNNRRVEELTSIEEGETLNQLTETDIFKRRMAEKNISEERKADLLTLFKEVLTEIDDDASLEN